MICPVCNAANEADATFCTSCGRTLTTQGLGVTPPFTLQPPYGYGQAAAAAAPQAAPVPPAEIEAIDYSRYVDLLCKEQGFLAQLAIRFYYVTGLKSYLVTHHDCFVVPNPGRDAAEIIDHIKQEMDRLGHQELMMTFLYMRKEHIQTLPYLSRNMTSEAGVIPGVHAVGFLTSGIRLTLEVMFGFIYLIVDAIKWIFRSATQGAGLGIRAVGRNGKDEMVKEKRLLLASTYRHTRTYTYVRDIGPETYVGWFTHHEPVIGGADLLALNLAFLGIGLWVGIKLHLPFLALFGVAGGIAFTFWFAPWLLNRLGALPQPRYISTMLTAMSTLIFLLAGQGIFGSPSDLERVFGGVVRPSGPFGGYGTSDPFSAYGPSDPFLAILVIAVIAASYWLYAVAVLAFLRAYRLTMWHFDQFDAESHAHIVKQRIAAILMEHLESVGYSPAEITDILSQKSPGAGRYRRARI